VQYKIGAHYVRHVPKLSFTWKLFTCRNEQYLPDASSNLKTGERDNALSAFLEYTVSSIFMVSLNAVEI
jgi:hypothetical protein